MADVEPLRALHYDLARVGSLADVAAPPYDVIDAEQRRRLADRSPYNVVRVDLPEAEPGQDIYAEAARIFEGWQQEGAVVRDDEPALWTLTQDYVGPDGRELTRHGVFARVRVEDYGPGRIRPHERTHPGPKEDRLRLTRATKANLSPIFSLYDDPSGATAAVLQAAEPFGEQTDDDGTVNRLGRVSDPAAIEAFQAALEPAELLIADGHHRYETARVYAEEIGGEGEHRYVLMCLVALQDEGLTVFPTHRLIRDTTPQTQEALANTLRALFDIEEIGHADLRPPDGEGPLTMGYIDSFFKRRLPPDAEGPGDRGRGAARPARGLPTASTPPCSRRWSSTGRSASARTTSPTSAGSATAAPTTRRSSSCSRASTTPPSSCARRRSSRCAPSRRPE